MFKCHSGTTLAHSAQLIYGSAHPFHFPALFTFPQGKPTKKTQSAPRPAQCINLKPQGMSAGKADYFSCIGQFILLGFVFSAFLQRSIPVFFLSFSFPPFFGGFSFLFFCRRRRVLCSFALTVLKQNLSTLQFVKYADGAAFTY